jgi:two-component system chemotaxis response regulator CheY
MSYDTNFEIFEQPLMAGPKKIMVVDDSSSIRQMLAFHLQNAGYEVIQAVDGQEAVEKLKLSTNSGINLFIVDKIMPRMDGLTLVRQLRSNLTYKKTPILVMDSLFTDADKAAARAAGATGFIVKPFDPLKIVEISKILIV